MIFANHGRAILGRHVDSQRSPQSGLRANRPASTEIAVLPMITANVSFSHRMSRFSGDVLNIRVRCLCQNGSEVLLDETIDCDE